MHGECSAVETAFTRVRRHSQQQLPKHKRQWTFGLNLSTEKRVRHKRISTTSRRSVASNVGNVWKKIQLNGIILIKIMETIPLMMFSRLISTNFRSELHHPLISTSHLQEFSKHLHATANKSRPIDIDNK